MVRSKNDKAFDVLVYGILLFVLLITLIPVMFVISMSFTPYAELIKRGGFVRRRRKADLQHRKQQNQGNPKE